MAYVGAIPVRRQCQVNSTAPTAPSYQYNIQAATHAIASEQAYSTHPESREGFGGNPVPLSHAIPPSYGAYVGGIPVSRGNPAPPSYGAHIGGIPVGQSNPVRQSYGAPVGGIPVAQCNPVRPSYGAHVGGNPVPRSNLVPPSYEAHIGGNPVPRNNPVPASYAEYVSGYDDSMRRAPVGGASTQGKPPDSGVVEAELRRKKWAMFVLGNLISAAVVISEIAELNVCFAEYVGNADDDDITSGELEEQIDYDASITNGAMMFTLVFGLWVEVFSACTLSLIYRSPLDIKSVHKIPSDDVRHCGGTVIIHFLAPFSWAVIYLCGGVTSIYFSMNSSCGGQGGSGVEYYLALSGLIMTFGGLLMLALSVLILFFSCGSPSRRTDGCCAAFRRKVNTRVLSKGPYLDIFWQLQGSVWSYRTGGFGLLAFISISTSGVLGEVLAACGSLAPDIV